jgi:hypothetical protein
MLCVPRCFTRQVDDKGTWDVTAPVDEVDIRNTQTRTLRVGLVGGLCEVRSQTAVARVAASLYCGACRWRPRPRVRACT